MTRLLTDGAESGDITRTIPSGPATVSSSIKRTGNYSYYTNSQFNNNGSHTLLFSSPAVEWYLRIATKFSHNAGYGIVYFYNGGSQAGYIGLDSQNGAAILTVYDNATVRATASGIKILPNEWHVWEVHWKHAASGVIEVKFDGTRVINFTGITNAQSQTDRLFFVSNNPTQLYIDDVAANNTSGTVDNSWVGDGGVLAALVPTATGTYGQMLVSGSATGWQATDEIPANSTDFIYESITGSRSTFNMSDLSGLPAGASISRLWVELYAKETAATGDKIATLLRSGGIDSQGSDQALTTAYGRYLSAEYLVDPQNTGTWTVGNINALEVGGVVQ